MHSLYNLVLCFSLVAISLGQGITSDITVPYRFAYILFPGFEALDVFGPLDVLNSLSLTTKINLTLIADTLEPVANGKVSWWTSPVNATFGESVVPTHTFANPPSDIDVLVVPGGLGTRAPDGSLNSTIAFVKDQYPKVKYLITICTGAGIASRAGVLDGKCATSNKAAWATVLGWGPKVKWVAQARWVQDGNIWTSSGVSAGIDAMVAFVAATFGEAKAADVVKRMEYRRTTNSTDDPFAAAYGLSDEFNSTNQETERC